MPEALAASFGPADGAPRERVTIRLGTAVSLAELEAWFETAAAGDKAVYASGFALPRDHRSVKRVAEWSDRGWAYLTRRRDPADKRLWLFEVHKGTRAGQRAANVSPDLSNEQERYLLKYLRGLAEAGAPCPSYGDLARQLALACDRRGRDRVRYLLQRLKRQRRIDIEPGAHGKPIVVTILAPGEAKGCSTARYHSSDEVR